MIVWIVFGTALWLLSVHLAARVVGISVAHELDKREMARKKERMEAERQEPAKDPPAQERAATR